MNITILTGRLGADPVVRVMPDGSKVANMRLATDESYKNNKGEKIAKTEWHRVVTFGRLAEVAEEYMAKGRLVTFTGKLRTRKWSDEHGIDRYSTEIVAGNMQMLDKAPTSSATDAPAPAESDASIYEPINEVPF